MKIKAVIFDFNGTLFFDDAYHYRAWRQIIQEITGEEVSEDIREKIYGKNNKEILYSIKPELTAVENEHFSKKKEELYRSLCLSKEDDLHLVAGANSLFDYLKKQEIPFTIASASIKENIDFFIDVFSLDTWFDEQAMVYDNGKYTNKIEMFKDASKLLGVSPIDCLVIEDSIVGIQAAKQAGIGTIIGIGPSESYDALRALGVDACISDFTNFPYVLCKEIILKMV